MKTTKILSLILMISFLNLLFLSSANVTAKAASHHVVSKSDSDTDEHANTAKTTDESKSKAESKNKSTDKTTATSKSDDKKKSDLNQKYDAQKPLKSDSATDIANNLPTYLKEWMKYLNKSCGDNCKLTYDDVLELIEDPNITGQQAAVLGAIVTEINNQISNGNTEKEETFTLKQLQNYFNPNKAMYYSYYKTALQNINGVRALSGPKEKLFGPSGALSSSTQIVQNQLGDCFVLSAINGLLNTPGGPEKLQKMITRVPGKSDEFIVHLPGDPKDLHIKLTQTKLAMYSNLTQGGEWLAVLSDAEARARKENPEKGVFLGGYQTQTLHLLTGVKYENRALSPFTRAQIELLKSLTKEQWSALENFSNAELAELSSLTKKQLESILTTDQLKAFESLTPDELSQLQKISSAQWNDLGTVIYNDKNQIDLKLLKELQPLTQEQLTKQFESELNTALNKDKPPQIVGIETTAHDLTILAFDPKTGMLTIKNPWGDTGWYNPINGDGPDASRPKDGTTPPWFDMSKGIFQVQLSQLVESNFVTITLPKSIVDNKKTSDNKTLGVTVTNQNNTTSNQLQTTLDTVKNHTHKSNAAIDEAQAAIDKMNSDESEIAATKIQCQNQSIESGCQNKLKRLTDDLNKATAESKKAVDKAISQ